MMDSRMHISQNSICWYAVHIGFGIPAAFLLVQMLPAFYTFYKRSKLTALTHGVNDYLTELKFIVNELAKLALPKVLL